MSLLVVGSVAFDAIQTPFHEAERVLGGAAMYFAVAASFFTHVKLVGVVGDDFTEKDADIFERRRIDTRGLEHAPGKTFFWAGKYSADFLDRTTLATELNVFASFNPRLPEAYKATPYIFLANIDPTLQRSVLQQVTKRPKLVALDTMNYWIERTPEELRETLKRVDVLMINDTETRQLSSEHNLLRAAAKIRGMGPRTLVIKRGEFGALLVHNNSVFAIPGFLLDDVQDPTGAGDTFAGGFMGYLAGAEKLSTNTLRQAMVYGSVLGSYTCERFGPERLRTLTRREINARARHFFKLTQFSL
ncbi:MAG TPA: PfkB family carbohydrate kinase [Candidatus Acidoferrales bacterium]|jgi:sugar/nucleoside kinase (ribokinase family)|nr:PfkB family carbohydrate kinase [Candidatus Acidoferrales bacterium]